MAEEPFRLRGTQEQDCPQCGARIVHDRMFVPWCQACDWNVEAGIRQPRISHPLVTWARRFALRAERRIYDELLRRKDPRPPRVTLARLGATLISLAVIAIAVLLAVLGFRILFGGPFQPGSLFGLLLILIALVSRPRVARLPEHTIDAADVPELKALVAELATALRTPKPAIVAVDADWNAYTVRIGYRQRRALVVGMPLWAALDPQERVALLGHELAHWRNGDPTRGALVSIAIQTLGSWYELIVPEAIMPAGGGLAAIFAVVINLFLLVVAETIHVVLLGLLLLVMRDHQRAEYYADRLASTVAGTKPTVEGLLIGRDFPAFQRAVAVTNRERGRVDLWAEIGAQLDLTSDNERERLRRGEMKVGAGLEASHPPIAHRVELLRASPAQPGSFALSQSRSDRIDAELAAARNTLTPYLLERHEARQWGM